MITTVLRLYRALPMAQRTQIPVPAPPVQFSSYVILQLSLNDIEKVTSLIPQYDRYIIILQKYWKYSPGSSSENIVLGNM